MAPSAARPLSPRARLREQAAVIGAVEQVQRIRELGNALDSLVRALKQDDPLAEGFARRAHQLWFTQADRKLEVLPTELRTSGRVVLASSQTAGRFILLAYNAGLRALYLRDTSTPYDLYQLGEWLAALSPDADVLRAFSQWLWCGTAIGLDAHLVDALDQLGESVVRAVPEAELWAERSSRAVEIWNEMAWKVAQQLPKAAVEQRFARPLADAERRAAQGELDLDDASVELLSGMADDAAAWTAVEVSLLRQQPALRTALSAQHLSWILASIIDHVPRLDPGVLGVLSELGCDLRRAETAASDRELDYRVLGASLASRLLEQLAHGPLEDRMLDAFGPALRGTILNAVCEQGEHYRSGPELIAVLARRWGVDELLRKVDLAQLGPIMAGALASAALLSAAEPETVMAWVARLALPAAIGAVARVPELVPLARPLIERALGEQPALAGFHLPELVRSDRAAAGIVGSALLAVGARDIPEDALVELLAALMEQGQGRAAVLPLFERPNHTVTVRRCALIALQDDVRLLQAALGGADRAREPGEIRQLLEELRWKLPK